MPSPLTPDLPAARAALYANRDRNARERHARASRNHGNSLFPRESSPAMLAAARVHRARQLRSEQARWREMGRPVDAREEAAA